MLLVPKEAYNSSGLLNFGDSSKSRNNTTVKILELYCWCLAWLLQEKRMQQEVTFVMVKSVVEEYHS